MRLNSCSVWTLARRLGSKDSGYIRIWPRRWVDWLHHQGPLCSMLVDLSSKCVMMYKHCKVRWRQRSCNERFSCIGQTRLRGRTVRRSDIPSQPEGLREAYMAGKMLWDMLVKDRLNSTRRAWNAYASIRMMVDPQRPRRSYPRSSSTCPYSVPPPER